MIYPSPTLFPSSSVYPGMTITGPPPTVAGLVEIRDLATAGAESRTVYTGVAARSMTTVGVEVS